jgi:hypothetical protein
MNRVKPVFFLFLATTSLQCVNENRRAIFADLLRPNINTHNQQVSNERLVTFYLRVVDALDPQYNLGEMLPELTHIHGLLSPEGRAITSQSLTTLASLNNENNLTNAARDAAITTIRTHMNAALALEPMVENQINRLERLRAPQQPQQRRNQLTPHRLFD